MNENSCQLKKIADQMNENGRQLKDITDQIDSITTVANELVKLIKQDDLPKAKSFLTVIEGGKKD